MNDDRLVVWGMAGSLRQNSVNKSLLRSAASLAPYDVEVRISELLPEVPLFNEDLVGAEPLAVHALRDEVAAADALLIATPEYNGGVPGVLKNALDWLSLPLGRSVLQGKPVAIMGASPGRLGTARSQLELRTTFIYSHSLVVPGPEVLVGLASKQFDAEGRLTNPVATDLICQLFDGLKRLARLNEAELVCP